MMSEFKTLFLVLQNIFLVIQSCKTCSENTQYNKNTKALKEEHRDFSVA